MTWKVAQTVEMGPRTLHEPNLRVMDRRLAIMSLSARKILFPHRREMTIHSLEIEGPRRVVQTHSGWVRFMEERHETGRWAIEPCANEAVYGARRLHHMGRISITTWANDIEAKYGRFPKEKFSVRLLPDTEKPRRLIICEDIRWTKLCSIEAAVKRLDESPLPCVYCEDDGLPGGCDGCGKEAQA